MSVPERSTCAIGVMAKAPQAGFSKTRLCPPLRSEEAAALSAAFLRDTTETISVAARSAAIAPYATYAPRGADVLLSGCLARGTALLLADGEPIAREGVNGFGRSLLHAIEGMLAQGHVAACVLNSDSPTLPSRLLVQAAELLLAPGDRAIIGPADDGGYYLLGLKAPHADMFADIAWSSGSVADATRARARTLGLELVELEPWFDVDDVQSLQVLLRDTLDDAAPETKATIDRLGLRKRLLQPQAIGIAG
jgi:uncharacterized protein